MSVVQEIHRDGITIRFHDDYFRDRSAEDIQRILDRIAAHAQLDLHVAATPTAPQ